MRTLIIISVILMVTVLYCSYQRFDGIVEIDLTQKETSIELIPDRFLTTSCIFKFEGDIDCEIQVGIPGERSLYFTPGNVRYQRSHQLFDKGTTIKIYANGCTNLSKLNFSYSYSAMR